MRFKHLLFALCGLIAMPVLVTAQPPGRGGPPGGGGPQGPPPRPGQVLPDFIVESLGLNDRQQRQLNALQADVDKRLSALLTDAQLQQLQNPPQHGPPGRDGQDQGNGRPRRPQ